MIAIGLKGKVQYSGKGVRAAHKKYFTLTSRSAILKPMKLLIVWMASLSALFAQDIVGTWQGTAAANGRDIRMVIKIAREGGNLSATLYNIDAPNPRPTPATST